MAPVLGFVVATSDGPARIERLVASLERHNPVGIPLAVVPTAVDALTLAASGDLDICVVLDPRLELIGPVTRADLMADPVTPFTFASEERERRVSEAASAVDAYAIAREAIGLTDGRRLRTRGLSTWSSEVVRAWRDEWLVPRGWSFADALRECPDADAWYLTWLLHSRPRDAVIREPIVAAIDTEAAMDELENTAVTYVDLTRAYVGVVLPGSIGAQDVLAHAPQRSRVIAGALPMRELARAFVLRCTRKAPRAQGWLGLSR